MRKKGKDEEHEDEDEAGRRRGNARTSFTSSSWDVLGELGLAQKTVQGKNRFGSKSICSAIYPESLCEAIARGMVKQKGHDDTQAKEIGGAEEHVGEDVQEQSEVYRLGQRQVQT